jgi:Lar family restriction alleviation protein
MRMATSKHTAATAARAFFDEDPATDIEYMGTLVPSACPFCGGISVMIGQSPTSGVWHSNCGTCGAEGPPGETMNEAANLWNRRRGTNGAA